MLFHTTALQVKNQGALRAQTWMTMRSRRVKVIKQTILAKDKRAYW